MTLPTVYNEDFVDSMLPAWPEMTKQYAQSRWDIVRGATTEFGGSPSAILDLVRMLFGIKTDTDDVEAGIRRIGVSVDPLFANSATGLEKSLLAGNILATLMQGTGTTACIATLATITADCTGARTTDAAKRFVELAKNRRRQLAYAPLESAVSQLEEAVASAFDDESELNDSELKALGRHVVHLTEYLRGFSARHLEQTDIAWWLLGESSTILDEPFSDVPEKIAPIAFGIELATLAKTAVGPSSARAILRRVLGMRRWKKELSIETLVKAVPSARLPVLLREHTGTHDVNSLTPLHLALKCRVADEPGWKDTYTRVAGIRITHSAPAVDLSFQIMAESLLIRQLNHRSITV